MEINHFIGLRQYLYHLTDSINVKNLIQNGRVLYSATQLVQKSDWTEEKKQELLRTRRPKHELLNVDGTIISIRDQRPISITNLKKCIPDDLTVGDYLEYLNRRVFFWPTLGRLTSHYTRYVQEKPMIIRVETSSLFKLNTHPEFSRINSGATRSNVNYNGAPPPRGEDTFLEAYDYPSAPSSVAEVTFHCSCLLPRKVTIAKEPEGPWTFIIFNK